jgi:MFS family permease
VSFSIRQASNILKYIVLPSFSHFLPFILYALIALPIFYKVEEKAEDGIIKIELIRNPVLRLTFLLGLCAGLAEAAVIFVPSMLTKTFGVSESTASFMLMPMVIAMLIGALLSGKATDKIGPRLTLIIAGMLTSFGFLIVGIKGDHLYWMYSGGILVGLSLAALLGAPLRFLVNSNTERSMRASGQGVVTVSTGTGQIISAALLGALITSLGNSIQSFMSSFLVISIIGIFVMILAFLLPKNNNAQAKS